MELFQEAAGEAMADCRRRVPGCGLALQLFREREDARLKLWGSPGHLQGLQDFKVLGPAPVATQQIPPTCFVSKDLQDSGTKEKPHSRPRERQTVHGHFGMRPTPPASAERERATTSPVCHAQEPRH